MRNFFAVVFLLAIGFYSLSYSAVTWHFKAGYAKPRLDMDGYFMIGKYDKKFYARRHFGFKPIERDHWYVDIGLPFLPNLRIENQPFAVYGKKWMKFPEGVENPVVRKVETSMAPIMAILLHGDVPYEQMSYYADKIVKREFERIKGVGEVSLGVAGALYLGFETEFPFTYLFNIGLESDFKGFAYLNTWYVDIKAIAKLKLTTFRNIGVVYWGVGYKYWHMVLKKLPTGKLADPRMDIKMDDYFTELGIEF